METIKKMLATRQLAIKLFMNVMYGYTGASFSGRMPCSDIADAVVETAKTILTNSIKYIVKILFLKTKFFRKNIRNGMHMSYMVIQTACLFY